MAYSLNTSAMGVMELGLHQKSKIFTMKKMIVPIDFSEVSRNAAYYAAQMSADIKESEILLYHVYAKYTAGADGSPLSADDEARKTITEAALNNIRKDLLYLTSAKINILAEEGDLPNNLELLVRNADAQIIIMGISGSTKLDQILIGSNTLKVIRKISFPVLIIPPGANYKRITKAVFASDFKNVELTTPIVSLRQMLELFRPELHVIHIDEAPAKKLGDNYKSEKEQMDKLLVGLNPQYSFLEANDFVKGISNYVKDNNANLIITVPRWHNFLNEIFKTTHTEKLVYHTDVPILAIHE
jgi:nucleotide-binding universal stress UspA family protein